MIILFSSLHLQIFCEGGFWHIRSILSSSKCYYVTYLRDQFMQLWTFWTTIRNPFHTRVDKTCNIIVFFGALRHILMQLVFMFDLNDGSFKLLLACIY